MRDIAIFVINCNHHITECGSAPKLLAEDCFDLGVIAYQAGRYGQGLEWLRMADELARQGKHGGVVNHTEVLEHLAWVEYIVRNVSWHVCCAYFECIRHSSIQMTRSIYPLSTQPSNR